METNRPGLIFFMAVAGVLILFFGLHGLLLSNFSAVSFVPVVAGMGLCIGALMMGRGERDETIGFYRILLIYLVSLEIIWFGVMGYFMDAKRPLVLYYAVILTGVIILFAAFIVTYRHFGHPGTGHGERNKEKTA